MKSIVKDIVILSIVLLVVLGCEKVPKYNETPEISYNNLQITRNAYNTSFGQFGDSIKLSINYKDGDGDLGYTADQLATSETNYKINVYIKKNGQFQNQSTLLPLDGKFPKLGTDKVVGPISGVLTFSTFLFHFTPFAPNDTVRFDVRILDRANHSSNTIVTPEIVVYQ